jgi:TrmH family RNA methyltransferase
VSFIKSEFGEIMIKISSKDNPLIKNIIKLNKSAKYRREQGLFVAEGLRLCEDAMLSKCEIYALVVTEIAKDKYSDTVNKLISYSENSYTVPTAVFSAISDTKTPQGILCIIKTLDKPTLFDTIKYNGKFLALDNIQDPANLGTIFRTAEAVGIDGIIMSKDCCDVYSPKVVRGTMGAVFRMSYLIVDSISSFLRDNRQLASYAAVVDRNSKSITDISFDSPCISVIGNEGNGIKADTLEVCHEKFTIPMAGRAESLNASVAASIVMWEMVR